MLRLARTRRLLLLTCLLGTRLSAQSGQGTLLLSGEGGASKSVTMAELAALPQSEVVVTGRDSSRVALRGPTVRSLMTLVGAPGGHELRGPNMLLVVVAEASDGYKVAYALSELDEQFNDIPAIVAISQNGAALPAAEGPFRIVIGGGGAPGALAAQPYPASPGTRQGTVTVNGPKLSSSASASCPKPTITVPVPAAF